MARISVFSLIVFFVFGFFSLLFGEQEATLKKYLELKVTSYREISIKNKEWYCQRVEGVKTLTLEEHLKALARCYERIIQTDDEVFVEAIMPFQHLKKVNFVSRLKDANFYLNTYPSCSKLGGSSVDLRDVKDWARFYCSLKNKSPKKKIHSIFPVDDEYFGIKPGNFKIQNPKTRPVLYTGRYSPYYEFSAARDEHGNVVYYLKIKNCYSQKQLVSMADEIVRISEKFLKELEKKLEKLANRLQEKYKK